MKELKQKKLFKLKIKICRVKKSFLREKNKIIFDIKINN